MTRLARLTTLFALVPTLFGGLATSAPAMNGGFVGPHEAGLRWIHGADLNDAWIPSGVSFAAKGDLVWAGTQTISRRLMLLGAPQHGVVSPELTDPAVALASNLISVEGRAGDQLFSLLHYPEPDLAHRRTVISRHSALQTSATGSFAPVWTASFPFVANGPSLMAVDAAGASVVAAAFNDSTGQIQVQRFEGATGVSTLSINLSGQGLESLAVSADGTRFALGLGQRLLVLDNTGNLLHDEILDTAVIQLVLDGDGSRLVVGKLRGMRLYDWTGNNYQLSRQQQGSPNELASKLAISEDGQTYAVAWWRFGASEQLRYEVFQGPSHQLVNQVIQGTGGNGLQNAPVAVEMTDDGQRVVFASWGKGDGDPEVVLLQVGQAQPLLQIDLPGSAMSVDLNPSGTQVAVGTKNLHANQVGSTGEVRLYDTGERELELVSPARVGGELKVQARRPGSSFAFFLVGQRTSNPTQPPGTVGSLMLARDLSLLVFPRPSSIAGDAAMSHAIPAGSAWLGAPLSIQVAHRMNGQLILSETVLDPLFY